MTSVIVTDYIRKFKDVPDRIGYSMNVLLWQNIRHIPSFLKADNMLIGLVSGTAKTRVGKMLPKGTKVLMSNGAWNNIEDLKIGDKVISPSKDGKSSTIANITG